MKVTIKFWQEDQLQALFVIPHELRYFETLVLLARELGFEFCAYGLLPFPCSRPRIVMFNNYPAAWQARYRERNYLVVDPTVQHWLRSPLPVGWSDDQFTSARDFWDDARSFGLRFGWAQSSRDVSGGGGIVPQTEIKAAACPQNIDFKSLKAR